MNYHNIKSYEVKEGGFLQARGSEGKRKSWAKVWYVDREEKEERVGGQCEGGSEPGLPQDSCK